MIDMPSGQIFEVLAEEYQFHINFHTIINNQKVIQSDIYQKIMSLHTKTETEILCHYNAEIA